MMAGVAQSVRALGCGSRGRRFDSGHSPHITLLVIGCLPHLKKPYLRHAFHPNRGLKKYNAYANKTWENQTISISLYINKPFMPQHS